MPGLAAVAANAHFDEQAAPVLVGAQAAPAVGQFLRQHRHDAIREVNTVAPGTRGVVQRGPGPHIPCDIGDRDDQPESRAVGLRVNRVVEVPRILPVDRNQRDVPDVLAPRRASGPRPTRLLQRVLGEGHGDVVGVDRDQADAARIAHAAQTFDDAGGFQAKAAVRQRFRQHQLVVRRAPVLPTRHRPLRLGAPVRGDNAPIGMAQTEHAQNARRSLTDPVDRAPLILAGTRGFQPCEHPVPRRQRGLARLFRDHADDWRAAVRLIPGLRPPHGIAIEVRASDQNHRGVRQRSARPARMAALIGPGRGTAAPFEVLRH